MSLNSMTALKRGREQLRNSGIEGSSLDALVLLVNAISKPKEWLFSHDYILTSHEETEYDLALEKRAGGAPVAYIINNCEFMGIDFYVNENVLIPRNDTEILVEKLLGESKKISKPKILDLCTGSGCIAISAAYYNAEADITATDISSEAIKVSKANADKSGVSHRVTFYESDLFEIFEKSVQIRKIFDIIVSNPPYISKSEMPLLPEEVKREPQKALLGGDTGLEFYEKISEKSRAHLRKGGLLLFETGSGQTERVVEIMNKNGYTNIDIYKDLAGLNRVVKGEANV